MLFNSYYFLIYFLPIVLVLYYGAHRIGLHKCALIVLSIGSFVFYAYFIKLSFVFLCSGKGLTITTTKFLSFVNLKFYL